MKDLGTALALVLVIEGALYALFPEGMRRVVVQMLTVPAPILRTVGLAATCIGVIFVWLIRR
ncbi:MAG TPA: DUF2065 domain-containing protein [Stellaceae bacterium]|jgi:hypothetical protein|nr:DUF2065 domain-containing protein [Stellaceae bacterium]